MKRHPALRNLSSDHHQGLVQARRLVNASNGADDPSTSTEVERVARDFLAFWGEHTVPHFREEEEILLPAFARYGDPSQEPVVRLLVEHVQIRRLVADLQRQVDKGPPSPGTMRATGELLRAHIRHEENVVFPLIEATVPEDAMRELPR